MHYQLHKYQTPAMLISTEVIYVASKNVNCNIKKKSRRQCSCKRSDHVKMQVKDPRLGCSLVLNLFMSKHYSVYAMLIWPRHIDLTTKNGFWHTRQLSYGKSKATISWRSSLHVNGNFFSVLSSILPCMLSSSGFPWKHVFMYIL